jgi:hypothetical protein
MESAVLQILNACVLVVLWSDFKALFYGFNLWSVPGFISLSLVVAFNFSVATFLLLPQYLISSQAHNKLSISMLPSD